MSSFFAHHEYKVYEGLITDVSDDKTRTHVRIVLINVCTNEGLLLEDTFATLLEPSQIRTFINNNHFQFRFKCYGCLGIYNICEEDEIRDYVGFITEKITAGTVGGVTYERVKNVAFIPLFHAENNITVKSDSGSNNNNTNNTAMIAEYWVKFFSIGNFYFAHKHASSHDQLFVDISQSFQSQMQQNDTTTKHMDYHSTFLWNRGPRLCTMLKESDKWIVYLICGSIAIEKIIISTSELNETIANSDNIEESTFVEHSRSSSQLSQNMNSCQPCKTPPNELTPHEAGSKLLSLSSNSSIRSNVPDIFIRTTKKNFSMLLISRLGWKNENFKMEVKGVDDYGNVANYIESEQIVEFNKNVASFVQVRGSVPVFWKQISTVQGEKKIKFTRSDVFTCNALSKHLNKLKAQYGQVKCLTLLSKKSVENELFYNFNKAFNRINPINVRLLNYDLSEEADSKINKKQLEHWLFDNFSVFLNSNQFFWATIDGRGNFVKHIGDQIGLVRTCCFDCLDKTNSIQRILAAQILKQIFKSLDIHWIGQTKLNEISSKVHLLWNKNNDNCVKLLQGSSMVYFNKRKSSKLLKANAMSVKRKLQKFFNANSNRNLIMKQIQTMNCGLFRFDSTVYSKMATVFPRDFIQSTILPPKLLTSLLERQNEYTEDVELTLTIGSWNVNGGIRKNGTSIMFQDLENWILYPHRVNPNYVQVENGESSLLEKPSDIYVIGFQEIIDLNASSVLKATDNTLVIWKNHILKTINFYGRNESYVFLGKKRLVGIAILVFIKKCYSEHIRQITINSVKTGLGGKYGNKGGVSIGFILYNTSICFVISHLCAGPGASKCEQRNADYSEIAKKLEFKFLQSFHDNDITFWAGDLNYRVELPYSVAKSLANGSHTKALLTQDQLIREIQFNNVFQGFKEGFISFNPTYKFDPFTDIYDSSEKKRTPSYTDRILWWTKPQSSTFTECDSEFRSTRRLSNASGQNTHNPNTDPVTCMYYGCGDANVSDHKPIVAKFSIKLKNTINRRFYSNLMELLKEYGSVDKIYHVVPSKKGSLYSENSCDNVLSDIANKIQNHIPNIDVIKVYSKYLEISLNSNFDHDTLPAIMNINNIPCEFFQQNSNSYLDLDRSAINTLEFLMKDSSYLSCPRAISRSSEVSNEEITYDLISMLQVMSSNSNDVTSNETICIVSDSESEPSSSNLKRNSRYK